MRKTALVAALLLALSGTRIEAQSYRGFREESEELRERAKVRLGPLRLIPAFRLTDAGWDSNVYFRGGADEVVQDLTATLSPEVRACLFVGDALVLTATENPEAIAFAKERALRAFTNSFSAGLRALALGRFSLAAEYHDRSHVRRVTSELDRRIQDTSTGWTAGLFFETPRATALGLTGSVEEFRYRDPASDTPDDIYGRALDRKESTAGLEAYYRVFSESFVFASAAWTRYDFVHEESAWRDAEALKVTGGLRFPFVGRARGTLAVGWKSFRPDDPSRKPFAGLIASSDLALRVGRFGLSLGFARDNAFSYNETAYYYVDSRGRAGVSLYLAPFLRLDAGVQAGSMTWPEPQTVVDGGEVVIVERRRDLHRTVSIGPVLRLGGRTGLGVMAHLYRRTSNAPGFDVRRTLVGAFLTYEF